MVRNLISRYVFTVLLAFVSTTSFSQTTVIDSLLFEGLVRTYRVYIPKIYKPSKAVPLVLNLHGLNSNAKEHEPYTNFNSIADTANFILVHPNGLKGALGVGWNTFDPLGKGINDLGFFAALIDKICATYSINERRIYSTGMSNGGFMSYDLACFLSYRIAAIASVTGSMVPSHKTACDPKHLTPVMEIHGTNDAVVPYNGMGFLTFTNVDTLVKYWVNYNNCAAPVVSNLPNKNIFDLCTVEHHVYYSNGDKRKSTVELYKIIGGAHSWPGTNTPPFGQVTNQDFNASKEIWRFFSQHSLDPVNGIAETDASLENAFNVYPNPASSDFKISSINNQHAAFTIRIFNNIGQQIAQSKTENGILEVSKADLVAGLYTIEIVWKDNVLFKKIVIN